MFNRCCTIFLNGIKVGILTILILSIPKIALAQACCIDQPNCNPCEGGLSRIELSYNGDSELSDTYSVRDASGVIQSGFLTSEISINRLDNNRFIGDYIIITLTTGLITTTETTIITNCTEVFLGKKFDGGRLEVIEGFSPISGIICCRPEDTDTEEPSFENFPEDVVISLESGCEVEYGWTEPQPTDDCGVAFLIQPIPENTQVFGLGVNTISYTVSDLSDNTFTKSFTVDIIDEIPPVISNMPEDIELEADENCQAFGEWTSPTATDNCVVVEFTPSHDFETAFELGTTEVTYTAVDTSGNTTSRSFNVIVSDKTAPDLSDIPIDITVSADENCQAVVEWELPIATDNCSNNVELEGSKSPGDSFPLGTTEVFYTATDENNNKVTKSFKVTVEDDSAPVFRTFPEDMVVSVGNSCEIPVTWETPVIEENCSEANLELLEGSPQSGDVFNLGTRTVSYKASDTNGNDLIQSFEIEVVDDLAPVFSGCPQEIVVSAESSFCDAQVEWEAPQATDNCDEIQITNNITSGSRFEIGTTEVRYVAIDDSGNESECSFNVIVTNDFEPVVENCPESVELELFDRAGVRHEWEEPTINLECATLIPESNYNSGDIFPQGSTEVNYFYELNGEEVIFCSFTVNVELAEVEFEVTELMTPNGDGQNDLWRIEELDNFPNNSVIIVDRWGGEIYKAKGYNNENVVWDGSNKRGDLVPTGTYYYIIKVEFESKVVERNGFIELIR